MKRLILILPIFFTYFLLSAQTIDQLKQQISQAEQEIRLTNDILSKTQKEQSVNSNQLLLVRNNINNRKSIISNLDKQIGLINADIRAKSSSINNLETELKELKEEYSEMIYNSYKNYKLNNFMAFLFASKDFNDMTRRVYYIKRYTSMREQKAVLIDSLSKSLEFEINDLQFQRASLDSTLNDRNSELARLNAEEKNYRNIDATLRTQTKKYNEEIKRKQNEIAQIEKKIQQLVEEEARKAQAAAAGRTAAETEVFEKLTGQFTQNKGKLPYPVTGGVVIEKFGKHKSQLSNQVEVDKRGITLAGTKGANVRAVFDGEIMLVFSMGIWKLNVAINHGNYVTVYSNLGSVSVKQGDKVTGNEVIGKISEDGDNFTMDLSIMRTEGNNNIWLDPEQWLKR
ncbi:MAG: peptidoglycan DD-metalloendopeptidase family protein [Rikenellaceae bacterium]|nr:peptidoglycan DD-metalloendopeptidase family protein [Rikenellaceae bacterium]